MNQEGDGVNRFLDSLTSAPNMEPKQDDGGVGGFLDSLHEDKAASLYHSFRKTEGYNPEQAARVMKLSGRTGLPEDVIGRNIEEVEKQVSRKDFDVDRFRREFPITSGYIAEHPWFAAAARDEIEKLGGVEFLMRRPRELWPKPQSVIEREAKSEVVRKVADQRKMYDHMEALRKGGKDFGLSDEDFPAFSPPDAEFEKRSYEAALSERRAEEAFVAGEGKIGGFEAAGEAMRRNPAILVPFLSGAADVAKSSELYGSLKAMEAGTETDDQREYVQRFNRLAAAAERRGTDVFGKTAQIMTGLPAFAGEFAATGGLYRAGSVAAQVFLKDLFRRALGKTVGSYARAGVGIGVGAAVQGVAAMPVRALDDVLRRASPSVNFDDKGNVQVIPGSGESWAVAIPKAIYSAWTEVASERLGGTALAKALDSKVNRVLFESWAGKRTGATVEAFQKALRSGGINGVLGEMGEEEAAKVMKAVGGVEPYKAPTGEELLAQVLAFGSPQLVSGAIGLATGKREPKTSNPEYFREMGEKMSALDLAKKSPEEVAKVLSEVRKGSPHPDVLVNAVEFMDHFKTKVDPSSGKPYDPSALATIFTGAEGSLEEALDKGQDLVIPQDRYALLIAPTEHNAFFQDSGRLDPLEESQKETVERLKRQDEDDKDFSKVEARAVERLKKREVDVLFEETEKARKEAKAALEAVKASDILTQLENAGVKRLYWSGEDGKNVEELSKSGIPKSMIGDPKRVAKEGQAHAAPIDEVAERFGLTSEDLIGSIKDAVSARQKLEGEIESPTVGDDVMSEALEQEYQRILTEVAGEVAKSGEMNVAKISAVMRRRIGKAFSAQQGGAASEFIARAFRAMAERGNVGVDDLFKKFGPVIGREGKLGEGMRQYEQAKDKTGPRGAYIPPAITGGAPIVNLFSGKDFSTIVHESGHLFLDILEYLSKAQGPESSVAKDFNTLLKWFGVESADAWGKMSMEERRDSHEKFAEGFEAYALEGKSPSKALNRVFAQFRAWLLAIYHKVRGVAIEIPPEIRSVMDRMVATEAEILEAEQEAEYNPIAPTFLEMNEEEAEEYAGRVDAAHAESISEFTAKHKSVIAHAKKKWFQEEVERTKKEVEKEVNEDPTYIAQAILLKGEYPDGLPYEGEAPKISKKSAVDAYGNDAVKGLPRGMFSRGGQNVDSLAQDFGFSSGDQMLTALRGAGKRERVIEEVAQSRVEEKYGDDSTAEKIEEDIAAAIRNERRGEVIVMEARKLASKTKRRVPPVESIRRFAKQTIEKKNYREILPGVYQRAERKAAREAFEAAARGDAEAAFTAKRMQLENHYLAREAANAREEIEKIADYAEGIGSKDTQAILGKAGEQYQAQVNEIVDRFNFSPMTLKKIDRLKSLAEWVKEQEEEGSIVNVPDSLLSESLRTHYKEVPYSDLKDIADALKNLVHLAALKNQLLKDAAGRKLSEVASDVSGAIIEAKPDALPVELESGGWKSEAKRSATSFLGGGKKYSMIARQLDGWKDGGATWEALVRQINAAGDSKAARQEREAKGLRDIFSTFKGENLGYLTTKIYIEEFGKSLTREGVISIANHWGNLDSRTKVVEGLKVSTGRHLTQDSVKAVLDRTLSSRDWDFIQSTWDYLDTFFEEIASLHQRVTGLKLEKIEAEPFATPGRMMRGGYFPNKYNKDQSVGAAQTAQKYAAIEDATLEAAGASIRARTKHGHRKGRVDGVKAPMVLSFSTIFNHVSHVIHDLTHYETIMDVNKILGHPAVVDAIRSRHGAGTMRELQDAVQDIAGGDSRIMDREASIWTRMRRNVQKSILGFKVSTALLQQLGITQSLTRVGSGNMAKAYGRLLTEPKKLYGDVYAMSEMMRTRHLTQTREVNEIMNTIDKTGEISAVIDSAAVWGTTRSQGVVDVLTWWASYEKATDALSIKSATSEEEAKKLEATARAIADQDVLDTQGGGQAKDLVRHAREPGMKKLFTLFSNYFFTRMNLAREVAGRTEATPASVAKMAVDYLLLFPIPTALAFYMRHLLKGGGDDDEVRKDLAKELALDPLNGLFLIRDLAGAINYGGEYDGPAGLAVITKTAKAASLAFEGKFDSSAFIRSVNAAAGGLLGYPSSQIDATVRGFLAYMDGDAPITSILMGPPPKNRR